MPEYITVTSGRKDDKVVLWEKNNDHPADPTGQHEAFVAGKIVARVARTAEVNIRLQRGDLVQTADPETEQASPESVSMNGVVPSDSSGDEPEDDHQGPPSVESSVQE